MQTSAAIQPRRSLPKLLKTTKSNTTPSQNRRYSGPADYIGALDTRECATPGVCPAHASCIEHVTALPQPEKGMTEKMVRREGRGRDALLPHC